MISDTNFNAFDFYLNEIDVEKKQLHKIVEKKSELDLLLINLKWEEIVVNLDKGNGGNSKYYSITFGENVSRKISEITRIIEGLKHLKNLGLDILYGGENYEIQCKIDIRAFNHRIHITGNGIAKSIQGLGLGCKIYRAILEKEEYITSSDDQLSSQGKLLWNSLRKNKLFYTFFIKTRGFCFASSKKPEEIISILEQNIRPDYINAILWDEDFTKDNRAIIEKSSLSKLYFHNP